MSPRALDPLYRAREFPRMPSPRRQSRTQEQRLSRAERQIRAVASVATQPDAQSVAGTVYLLPPATLDDIGNTIVIHSAAGPGTQTYIGVLDPFGVPQWLLISSNDTSGSGSGGTIGGATFTADHQWTSLGVAAAPRAIATTSDGYVFIGFDNVTAPSVYKLNPSTGLASFAAGAGFLPTTTTVRGISSRTTNTGDIYVAGRTAKKLYRWNSGTSATVTSADTHAFVGVSNNDVDSLLYAAFAGTGSSINRYNRNTLNFSSSMSTFGSATPVDLFVDPVSGNILSLFSDVGGFGMTRHNHTSGSGVWSGSRPEIVSGSGVTCDSTFVYVADAGANKVHVYLLSTGVYQGAFGSSGSALDQLSAPQDVAVDGNNIYVADYGNSRIVRWVKS